MTQEPEAQQLGSRNTWANRPPDETHELTVTRARTAQKSANGLQMPASFSGIINGHPAELAMWPPKDGDSGRSHYEAYWTDITGQLTPDEFAQFLVGKVVIATAAPTMDANGEHKINNGEYKYTLKSFKISKNQPEPQSEPKQQPQQAPAPSAPQGDGFVWISNGGNTYDDRVGDGMFTNNCVALYGIMANVLGRLLTPEECDQIFPLVLTFHTQARGRHNGTPWGIPYGVGGPHPTDDDVEVL